MSGNAISNLVSIRKKIGGTGIIRISDRNVALVFVASFLVSLALCIVSMVAFDWKLYYSLQILSLPFIVLGVISYISEGRYFTLLFIAILAFIFWLYLSDYLVFVIYLLICSVGVVMMVEIIQRRVFYEVMDIVEHINVKKKKSIKDRLVRFFFSIPEFLDTRNVCIDVSPSKGRFPWKDVLYTTWFFLFFCMLLWIFVFLSSIMDSELNDMPLQTFTVMLYLLTIVMPWSVFSNLNARVVTGQKDFYLYNGLVSTVKKMIIPSTLILLLVLIGILSRPEELRYIALSLVMMVLMALITAYIYHKGGEMSVMNEVFDKWKRYHPTGIYSGLDGGAETSDADIPGTPKRDSKDCFKVTKSRGRY